MGKPVADPFNPGSEPKMRLEHPLFYALLVPAISITRMLHLRAFRVFRVTLTIQIALLWGLDHFGASLRASGDSDLSPTTVDCAPFRRIGFGHLTSYKG